MNKERAFWGVVLICAAALLVVNNLGFWWFPGFDAITIILAIVFGICFVKSVIDRNVTGAIFSVAFFYLTVDEPLHIQFLSAWTVIMVAVLLSIGCGMLFPHHHRNVPPYVDGVDVERDKEHFKNVVNEQDQEMIHVNTTFSSTIKYINTDNFKGAYLKCTFGGMKVYFDNAIVQGSEAYVDLDVSFGGVELFIPKTWQVVNDARATFGGLEEKNASVAGGAPILHITGNISFGGVTIIYV